MTVDGGPRNWRGELVVPLVNVLVKVLLMHQPVQVEEAGLSNEGKDDQLETKQKRKEGNRPIDLWRLGQ